VLVGHGIAGSCACIRADDRAKLRPNPSPTLHLTPTPTLTLIVEHTKLGPAHHGTCTGGRRHVGTHRSCRRGQNAQRKILHRFGEVMCDRSQMARVCMCVCSLVFCAVLTGASTPSLLVCSLMGSTSSDH